MSTTQPTIPQPELIANMLSFVSPSYRHHLNTMLTDLPHEEVNLFIKIFTNIFNYLPTTLPKELSTLSSQNFVLPTYLLTMIKNFTDTLNTVHSYLLTIIHFNLPSPNLSPLCSDILDDLHFTLYTNMNIDIPTQLISLRTALHPLPLTQPSWNLDDLLMHLVYDCMPDLSFVHASLLHELESLPETPSPVTNFVYYFDIDICIERLRIDPDDNPEAEDYDLEELSLKYVHQAKTDAETDPENCSVCLEDMKDGDNARRLRCLHAFHVDCIDRWLEMNDTCPICRTHINATHESESTVNGAGSPES